MNENESKIFYETLEILNHRKNNNPKLFNNSKTKYLFKDERPVSNNVIKGVIMFELNNKYIVDLYVDNGVDNILNGLINKIYSSFDEAKEEYNRVLEYLENNDLKTILLNGKIQLINFD